MFFSEFPVNLVIGFLRFASLLAFFILMCDLKRGYGGHLDYLIKKFLVNLCEATHENGDDLIKFYLSNDNKNGRQLTTSFLFF